MTRSRSATTPPGVHDHSSPLDVSASAPTPPAAIATTSVGNVEISHVTGLGSFVNVDPDPLGPQTQTSPWLADRLCSLRAAIAGPGRSVNGSGAANLIA